MRMTPGQPATFNLTDLCDWTSATPPQIEYWVRLGIVVPLDAGRGRGSPRVFSLTNVIECALARELTSAGLAVKQLQTVMGQLRTARAVLPPEFHASATFVRMVQMVDAIVAINGPGPNYAGWRKDVETYLRSWTKRPAREEAILPQLAALFPPVRTDAAAGEA